MKKFFALLMTMAMVLSLAACGSKEEPAAEKADEPAVEESAASAITTVSEGKLTVATSPDFAPYEFYSLDADGNPTLAGFDIAFAQYIADKLGLELNMVPMDFDGTLAELGAKKADLGMAGYSPDPDRENLMNFSKIYYEGGQSFVTVESKASEITSLEVANNAKYKIGAQTGSIQSKLAKENTPDADNIDLTKVTDVIADLLAGNLDGAFIETVVAEAYQTQYPELKIVCTVPYDQEGSAIGVNKDNAVLLAAINLIIDEAINDGSLQQFVAEAVDLATGDKYEGTLDASGKVPEADTTTDDAAE